MKAVQNKSFDHLYFNYMPESMCQSFRTVKFDWKIPWSCFFFFLKKEHLFLPVVFNVCVSIIFIHRCLSVLWNHIYMYHRSQHFNFNKTLRNLICLIFKKRSHQEFSGGPVVRTLCFYFWGLRFNPWTQN